MQKVAFITGCSTGIGHELALQLIENGWQVVATARRPETLEKLKKARCLVFPLDVTNPEQIKDTVEKAYHACGRIDLLINNAGYGLIAPTIDIPPEELHRQFQTNVSGIILLIQSVAPLMKSKGSGTIVNMGSISGIAPTPFSGAYCASKAAIHAWSDVLRMELKPFGIHVISVQPGGILTNFGKNCEKTVRSSLKPGSWYSGIEKFIYVRANTSQEKATPVEIFVKRLIPKILQKDPPAIIRMGKRSFTLPLMKRFLPGKVLDTMMMKKYGLLFLEKN
jgi:NAD(P)-dependent dehydrogenase (short-subunit alcohol dehydrogenase family)